MKKYLVNLCYCGSADFKVEAESESEAYVNAEQEANDSKYTTGHVLDSLIRYETKDMIEYEDDRGVTVFAERSSSLSYSQQKRLDVLRNRINELEIRLNAIRDLSDNGAVSVRGDDWDKITQIANYKEACEICNECGEGTMWGSGNFVNRVSDGNSIVERNDHMGKPFPCGDFICDQCETDYYDKHGFPEGHPREGEIHDGSMQCIHCESWNIEFRKSNNEQRQGYEAYCLACNKIHKEKETANE